VKWWIGERYIKMCEVLNGVEFENSRIKKINRDVEFRKEMKVEKWDADGYRFRFILVLGVLRRKKAKKVY
jgi:hypothetical protein